MSLRMVLALAAVISLSAALGCQPDSSGPQTSNPSPPARVPAGEPSAAPVSPAAPYAVSASTDEGAGAAAIRRARQAGKHVFLLVHESDDESTRTATKLLTATVAKAADKAEWAPVKRSDPREKGLVDTYGLQTAPMPIVLVLAPNGAVTSGFRSQDATEENLLKAFASPVQATCLKAMQGRKLVMLCIQGKSTKLNAEAMKGVDAFKADARFSRVTEVVRLDPADLVESRFLKQLGLDSPIADATTLLLAPPRMLLATFKGATDKEKLVAILEKASSGGCGAGGCGPRGCN